jgi:AmpD protein
LFDSNQQWLPAVRCVPSPNFNQRPADTEINLLVIHNISLPSGQFGNSYIEQLFTNCLDCCSHPDFNDLQDLRVSSHLLIDRNGVVTQFVPLDSRAWHAGDSKFCGRQGCNDFSIGIELEGTDDDPYTELQYQTLAMLTKQIRCLYPAITTDRIVGHSDIAPGRKTDPGKAFDWGYYFQLL